MHLFKAIVHFLGLFGTALMGGLLVLVPYMREPMPPWDWPRGIVFGVLFFCSFAGHFTVMLSALTERARECKGADGPPMRKVES